MSNQEPEDMAKAKILQIMVIYKNPKNYHKEGYVARRWEGELPTNNWAFDTNLEVIREWAKEQLAKHGQMAVKLMPHESDDPCIIETWL